MKKHIAVSVLGLSIGVYVCMSLFSGKAHAAFFGGMQTAVINCTCSGNQLVYVQDYFSNRMLALVYQPGASRLFSNYNIFGRYLLGSYAFGGQCLMAGDPCTTLHSDGQIDAAPGVGTSL